MFEEVRDIPRAVASHPADDPLAVPKAIHWFRTQAAALGGTPLLFVPLRNISGYDSRLVALSKQVRTESPRSLLGARWHGGAALAAWPTRDDLAKIDADGRTRALCVLTWNAAEVDAWTRARHPELLSPQPAVAPDQHALDPVVIEGLKTITNHMNQANGLTGYGRDGAVQVLRILKAAGYQLPLSEIYAWVLAAGWRDHAVKDLDDLVKKLNRGVKLRARRNELRGDILTCGEKMQACRRTGRSRRPRASHGDRISHPATARRN